MSIRIQARYLRTAALIVGIAVSGTLAHAADMPIKAAPVAAPKGPATSSDRFRVQRGSPRAFCRYDKSLFLSISYWKTLGSHHAVSANDLQP